MEHTEHQRIERLRTWVASVLPAPLLDLQPASADASFRRYFRATTADGSFVVMDAPPSHEDCGPWLKIAHLFRNAGANTPQIFAENLADGFILMSDLGSTTYLAALNLTALNLTALNESALNESALNGNSADRLYRDATASLIKIQLASQPGLLPPYDEALLRRELDLFPDWYVAKHLGVTLTDTQRALLETVFRAILDNNLAQPKVFVHRDWHSRNLMVTAENNPGVVDFQDAVYGPITYDLVSIYKDAYIAWDEDRLLDWVVRYWEAAKKAGLPVDPDFGAFYRDFEWMGAQRHIKVLGIFARLCHRDGKDGYLKDMPLVMRYLRRACERYRELQPLLGLLDALENRAVDVGYTF